MVESIENKVIQSLNATKELYYRLVLLVGKSSPDKTSVIQKLAKQYKTDPINVSLYLSKELFNLNLKQRQLKLSKILAQLLNNKGEIVFLDNIEILFSVELKQDPLRLLQGLSRNFTLVVSWDGDFDKGKLTYSEPEHSEYKSYNSIDALIVNTNGDTIINFK